MNFVSLFYIGVFFCFLFFVVWLVPCLISFVLHLSSFFKGQWGEMLQGWRGGGLVGREQKNAGATPVFVLKHM
jgi:hypothetical protein